MFEPVQHKASLSHPSHTNTEPALPGTLPASSALELSLTMPLLAASFWPKKTGLDPRAEHLIDQTLERLRTEIRRQNQWLKEGIDRCIQQRLSAANIDIPSSDPRFREIVSLLAISYWHSCSLRNHSPGFGAWHLHKDEVPHLKRQGVLRSRFQLQTQSRIRVFFGMNDTYLVKFIGRMELGQAARSALNKIDENFGELFNDSSIGKLAVAAKKLERAEERQFADIRSFFIFLGPALECIQNFTNPSTGQKLELVKDSNRETVKKLRKSIASAIELSAPESFSLILREKLGLSLELTGFAKFLRDALVSQLLALKIEGVQDGFGSSLMPDQMELLKLENMRESYRDEFYSELKGAEDSVIADTLDDRLTAALLIAVIVGYNEFLVEDRAAVLLDRAKVLHTFQRFARILCALSPSEWQDCLLWVRSVGGLFAATRTAARLGPERLGKQSSY